MEWITQFYWEDYKYYITIPLCLGIGFLAGWVERGMAESKRKFKRNNKISTGVYLEDMWDEG